MYEAYPLQWPAGYKRHSGNRHASKFKQTMEGAQRFLRQEISRLNAKDLVVSSNIPVRNDRGLYADYMRRKMDDPGVAIYFSYKGKSVSMCCDQYPTVWENIYALGKGIEALRGMERWGVSEFLDRVFTGFTALPESNTNRYWWQVLGVQRGATEEEIKNAYRNKAKETHPDAGGSVAAFQEVQQAFETAMDQLK